MTDALRHYAHSIEDMAPTQRGRSLDQLSKPDRCNDGHFDAFLYPNRSLANKGFFVVMSIVVGVNITIGLVFFSIGAWPVLGFCGLDILLVWAAFRLSYRQGRMHERVRVTQDDLLVSRVLASGHETHWRLQRFWTRVEIDHRGKHEARVRVISRGRTLILGSFLSPQERGSFGDALRSALTNTPFMANGGRTP